MRCTLATVLEAPEPAASPAVDFTRAGRIVTDFFLQQGVIGHAIALVGAVWIASAVLRAPAQAKRL